MSSEFENRHAAAASGTITGPKSMFCTEADVPFGLTCSQEGNTISTGTDFVVFDRESLAADVQAVQKS
jgi:hypothetical protein